MVRTAARIRGMGALAALLLTAAPLGAQGAAASSQAGAAAAGPAVGEQAPDFSLTAVTRYGALAQPVHLADLRGQTVVLAFFYKARTKGLTVQMEAYRDQYATLFNNGQKVVVLAVSVDPDTALVSWARDESFPMLFASDPGGEGLAPDRIGRAITER